jgi:ABC-2 type transport system permease protein
MYMPLLEGVLLPEKPFVLLCPVLQMLENQELLNIQGEWTELPGQPSQWTVTYEGFGSGWGYLAICAGVGILLLGGALLLYRRRKLEFAGDFLAFKPLEPVFAVLLALCTGCVFALFGSIFGTGGLVFFGVGLILGWFGGQMLLQRTVKVFKGKAFLKLGTLILAMALSLGLTAWDPLGITTFVPDVDRIERVEFGWGDSVEDAAWRPAFIDTTDEAIIQSISDIHKELLQQENSKKGLIYTLRYTLESGRQVTRQYVVRKEQAAFAMIKELPVVS